MMTPDIYIPQDGEFCELDFTATFRRTQASDQQERSTWIINTSDRDSYDTIIPPDNGDLSRYRKNPVVLINHSYSLQAGVSSVSKRGKGKQARIEANMKDGDLADGGQWDLDDPEIMRYYRKVQKGMMKGASIGFRAKWKRVLKEGGDPEKWQDFYYMAESWELFEWSIVTVPANPAALKTGRMLQRMGRNIPSIPTQIVVPEKPVTLLEQYAQGTLVDEYQGHLVSQDGGHTIHLPASELDTTPEQGVEPVQDGEDRSAPDQTPIDAQPQDEGADDQAQPDPGTSRSTDESGEEVPGTDAVVLVPTELLIHAACGGQEAISSLQHLLMIYHARK